MRTDVPAPFDVSVSRVGKVSQFQYQKDVLSGNDVDDGFQKSTDIPGDPLLP